MVADGRRHEERERGRRSSDVLDAIFDKVDHPDSSGDASEHRQTLFRAAALERMDVPLQVDTLLPLTSRRSWLLLVGAVALIVASIGYAAATTVTDTVDTVGRAVGATGVAVMVAPASGTVTDWTAESGTEFGVGESVLTIDTADGPVPVTAPTDGLLWQQLVLAGEAVNAGDPLATLLADDSDRTLLVAVAEADAFAVAPGDEVRLGGLTGTVRVVGTAPVPPDVAASRLAIESSGMLLASDDGPTSVVLVTVELDVPLNPGTVVAGEIVIDQSSLLSRMF